jgi:hypothetical protein
MPPKVQGLSRSGRMSKKLKELLIHRLKMDRLLLHQEKLKPAELPDSVLNENNIAKKILEN